MPPGKNKVDISRPTTNRRLSTVLSKHLESSSADDSASVWKIAVIGPRYDRIQGEMLGKSSFGKVGNVLVRGYEGSVARKSVSLQGRTERQRQKDNDSIQREVDDLQCTRHKHVVDILTATQNKREDSRL